MTNTNRVSCTDCAHFRSAPYESRIAGCFESSLMPGRQKDAYLDEQQIPGDHEKINLRGDCEKFEAITKKLSFLQRLLAS